MSESLRYKLRCFEIPLEGPAEVFCYNMPVVKNSSIPTSVLNKRHNAIYYHRFREAQAAGIIGVGWILGELNLSDFLGSMHMYLGVQWACFHPNTLRHDSELSLC